MDIIKSITNLFSSSKITEKDLEVIRLADWPTCSEWYNKFNSWKWVDELLPEEIEDSAYPYNPNGRRHLLMELIEEKIGRKYILMDWNTRLRSDPMSQSDFEDFWRAHYKDDPAAKKRYDAKVKSICS